jgi:hypothetical protein
MRRLRPFTLSLLALTCLVLSVSGMGASLAVFADTAAAGNNTLIAGYWADYFLHNNPTPPVGNTTAQANLTATTTAPTQATLYNYDTNCDSRTGRWVRRQNPPSPGLTRACRYVNWRLPVRTTALPLAAGSIVRVDIWSATDANQANRTGSLIAYLRDYNPGNGTYVEIANATYTARYSVGRTLYHTPFNVTISSAYTLAVGHQLELKIETPQATSQNNMMVAYDTTGYPSFLRLP